MEKLKLCEHVLEKLMFSSNEAVELNVHYCDFLERECFDQMAAKGRGAVVLAGPTKQLHSWFSLVDKRLRQQKKVRLSDLQEVSKVKYYGIDEMKELFGKHLKGGDVGEDGLDCEESIGSYDLTKELVFVRLYLSGGSQGNGTLVWDTLNLVNAPEDWSETCAKWEKPQGEKKEDEMARLAFLLSDGLSLRPKHLEALEQGLQLNRVPQFLDQQLCAGCGGERKSQSACGGCMVVKYCGRECQVAHWKKAHKAQCKEMKLMRQKIKK